MPSRPRRRFPRIECDHRAELRIVRGRDDAQGAPVHVRSMSMGGMGLAFDEWEGCDLEEGSPVVVRVPLGGTVMELPGRVAWARPRPWARMDIGVCFELHRTRDRGSAYAAFVTSMWAG